MKGMLTSLYLLILHKIRKYSYSLTEFSLPPVNFNVKQRTCKIITLGAINLLRIRSNMKQQVKQTVNDNGRNKKLQMCFNFLQYRILPVIALSVNFHRRITNANFNTKFKGSFTFDY